MLNRKTAVRGLVDRLIQEDGIQLQVQYEVETAQTAVALASSGLGISIVPGIALGKSVDPRIRIVPIDSPNAHRAVGIITARGYVQQRYAEQLITLIRTNLRGAA